MNNWHPKLATLLNRDFLPHWLNNQRMFGDGVEVGTYYGDFAEHILEVWRGTHLTCIDPWTDQPDAEYRDGCANGGVAGGRNPMEPIFNVAKQKLHRFQKNGRCTIIRHTSKDALEMVAPATLTFAYIDGNHAYAHARHDLNEWWKRVLPGGIMGIHDCYFRADQVQRCGVSDAVIDFSLEQNIRPFLTNCTSAWWIK